MVTDAFKDNPDATLSVDDLFLQLTKALAERRATVDLLDAYYRGDHPLPPAHENIADEVRVLRAMCRANWCKLVVDSGADGLRIVGIRRGDGTAGLNAGLDVWRGWWQPNRMDKVQRQVFTRALSCERSFLLVWPDLDDQGRKVGPASITVESPREMIVMYEPGSASRRLAALKSFCANGWCYQCLWTPARVYKRVARAKGTAGSWSEPGPNVNWQPWGAVGPSNEDPYEVGLPNPMGVVPVVEFAANVDDEGTATSDLAVVIPAQNRINETLISRVFTARNQSNPARVLIGEQVRTNDAGQPINPVKTGPDRVTQLENVDAKVTQWDAAELKGFIESIKADVMEITSLSRTPPTITIAELANIGADALRALKESWKMREGAHQDNFADPAEETLRLAMKADGADGADDQSLEVIWADLDAPSLTERGDFISKTGPYLPKSTLYTFAGLSPQAVEDAIAEDAIAERRQALTAPQPVAPPAAQTAPAA